MIVDVFVVPWMGMCDSGFSGFSCFMRDPMAVMYECKVEREAE